MQRLPARPIPIRQVAPHTHLPRIQSGKRAQSSQGRHHISAGPPPAITSCATFGQSKLQPRLIALTTAAASPMPTGAGQPLSARAGGGTRTHVRAPRRRRTPTAVGTILNPGDIPVRKHDARARAEPPKPGNAPATAARRKPIAPATPRQRSHQIHLCTPPVNNPIRTGEQPRRQTPQ